MEFSEPTYSRSGVRRQGDDYQDLVLLDTLVEWLEHSTRYRWVKVEADDMGALDDVTAQRADGQLEVKQVKYSVHPDQQDDPYSWDTLLKRATARSKSLLEKWSKSIKLLLADGHLGSAAVVSNRRASPEIEQILGETGLINFNTLKSSTYFNEIVKQIGTEDEANAFFANFHFLLNEPNLSEREEGIRRRFFQLGGTFKGLLNLKDTIRIWVRDRNQPRANGEIVLEDIRNASLWIQLRDLPQSFDVPDDYVLPDTEFHKSIQEKLANEDTACLLLTATPGTGKSTYASYLFQDLKEQGIAIVRHHYYLSMTDETAWSRLDHKRAAESILHDLIRDYVDALGEEADKNPDFNLLHKYMENAGSYYHAERKKLVVIIDGLDHVWREQSSIDELRNLLGIIFPIPQGVTLLLVTQPINALPQIILRNAPQENWWSLPCLNQEAVQQWLLHHKDVLPTFDGEVHEHQVEEFTTVFYQKSSGHPLYLKYAMKTLEQQVLPISVPSVQSLPSCPHKDINSYYQELWNNLNEAGQSILHLLAACAFSWPETGLLRCVGTDMVTARTGFREVQHLLVEDKLGWHPFHSSLNAFVRERPEHSVYGPHQKQAALDWMRSDEAPKYLAWSYEWLLEADLGNITPLLAGPTRNWAVNAFAIRRSRQSVQTILARSMNLALIQADLSRAIELGLLTDYCFEYNNYEFDSPVYDILLYPQLKVLDDSLLFTRLLNELHELNDHELQFLAESAIHFPEPSTQIQACIDEFIERSKYQKRHMYESYTSGIYPLLETLALPSGVSPASVVDWAIRNREDGNSVEMLMVFCRALRTCRNTQILREVLEKTKQSEKLHLEPKERAVALEALVLLAFESNLNIDDIIELDGTVSSFEVLYNLIRHSGSCPDLDKTAPDFSWLELKAYSDGEKSPPVWKEMYDLFFRFLVNHLCEKDELNDTWLKELKGNDWQFRFVRHLSALSQKVAEQITNRRPFSLGWFYTLLGEFSRENLYPSNDSYAFTVAANNAANVIGLDLLAIFASINDSIAITLEDLELIFSSPYCWPLDWTKHYVHNRRLLLDTKSLAWLLATQQQELDSNLQEFYLRAEHYGVLAAIAALHERADEARGLIYHAADNIVTHGNHKDRLFFGVMESIVQYHKGCIAKNAQDPETRNWLFRLVPAIASIRQYTDSDETGHLPSELADSLAVIAPEFLPHYYTWLSAREEYDDAQNTFDVFLQTTSFEDEVSSAIAYTAVEEQSLSILTERAISGDHAAEAIVTSSHSYFGEREEKPASDDKQETYQSYQNEPAELPSVAEFDPTHLKEYLQKLRDLHIYKDDALNSWIEYWSAHSSRDDVYKALCAMWDSNERLRDLEAIFQMALELYGKESAFIWLVRAHIDDFGWQEYYGDKERSFKRWRLVKELYPDRWLEFVTATFLEKLPNSFPRNLNHRSFIRLVEYCLYMDQDALARTLVMTMVDLSLEYVSPLKMSVPDWTNEE